MSEYIELQEYALPDGRVVKTDRRMMIVQPSDGAERAPAIPAAVEYATRPAAPRARVERDALVALLLLPKIECAACGGTGLAMCRCCEGEGDLMCANEKCPRRHPCRTCDESGLCDCAACCVAERAKKQHYCVVGGVDLQPKYLEHLRAMGAHLDVTMHGPTGPVYFDDGVSRLIVMPLADHDGAAFVGEVTL